MVNLKVSEKYGLSPGKVWQPDSRWRARGRPSALQAYRLTVPHHPLQRQGQDGIFQSFTVGRVRFLITDTRSARLPSEDTMLGTVQKQWLKRELLEARELHLIVWTNPDPWVTDEKPTGDNWARYAAERAELAGHICMISGDAHMVAAEEGANN